MTTLEFSLADAWAVRSQSIDAALEQWLPCPPDCPDPLARAIRHAVFPGGKRLRPLLTLMCCHAAGGDETAAVAPACAVELVHCYSLVHDDLPAMDDDYVRRGRPTVHAAYGEAIAILAGDALLTLAFEVIGRSNPHSRLAAKYVHVLAVAAGAAGMVGGQADDILAADGLPNATEQLAHLRSLHARKTGALLVASARLGALAAGAQKEISAALERYAQRVGLAFQIADDLLDVKGNPTKVGKPTGKDQSRGKLTFPGLLGVEAAAHQAQQLVAEACLALKPLGAKADELCELAHYIVEREH